MLPLIGLTYCTIGDRPRRSLLVPLASDCLASRAYALIQTAHFKLCKVRTWGTIKDVNTNLKAYGAFSGPHIIGG
jgi:hypothetical protein